MPATAPARPDPHVLVLFGARGDLAARKLFPGLFHLVAAGLMPEEFRIIGSGRSEPDSQDAFVQQVRDALQEHGPDELDEDAWNAFADTLSFVASSADDASDLAEAVRAAEEELGGEDVERLLYLSIPPAAMEPMVGQIGESGLAERARLVMEKPFGSDLESARSLNAALHEVVEEEQIFRIDHFLGKEAAQNVLALRFANGLFEPSWNRDHIASVQIDVPEELGLEGRGSFYEDTGAFRDMVVTHLCQLLGFVAMEPPVRMDAGRLRDEKAKLFEALRPFDPERVVFGQFEGYRDEEDVASDSDTESFAAVEAWVDTWRWQGVPFLLRTGKAMASGTRVITITFREPPLRMFGLEDGTGEAARANRLVLELSDTPRVRLELLAKAAGPDLELGPATMELTFGDGDGDGDGDGEGDGDSDGDGDGDGEGDGEGDGDSDGDGEGGDEGERGGGGAARLEAYERLLHDVLLGDHTLFTRADEVERLWEVAAPVLESPPAPEPYAQGSWGPQAALELPPAPGWRLGDD